jgi:hypothetical protein
MTSYRSDLGGIASGIAVTGTLVISRKIKVKSVKFVCENEAAIKACKIKRTQSVSHITEDHNDLISTIQLLQEHWFQEKELNYEWVNGQADKLN